MPDTALRLHYEIEFTTAFHIGSGYGLAGVVDATPVRRRNGNLYVPGASVKGRARWRLTGLLPDRLWDHDLAPCVPSEEPVCELCNLFGSTWVVGPLVFGDAALDAEDDLAERAAAAASGGLAEHERRALCRRTQVERRNQVSLSRRRRVSKEELLFVTEVGQAGLRFNGSIQGVLPDRGRTLRLANGTELPTDLGWLIAALRSIEHLGGRKSRGLGHCRITVSQLDIGSPGAELQPVENPDDILRALRLEVGS